MSSPANSPELEACMNKLGWYYEEYINPKGEPSEYYYRKSTICVLILTEAWRVYRAVEEMMAESCACNAAVSCSYHSKKEEQER